MLYKKLTKLYTFANIRNFCRIGVNVTKMHLYKIKTMKCKNNSKHIYGDFTKNSIKTIKSINAI